MPEMTQSDSPTKNKHRKKNRESHNEVERHRKKKINSGINRIGELIPCSPALKQSKNMILEQAFKYITELKRQNDELLLNGGDKEQAGEIRKLRKELAEIQKENARYIELLKSNDICLYDDPTLHWKGKMKKSKASLTTSMDPAQKLPLCINGNQLGSSNQNTAVHGITFNVSHNLPKQTANVVPVQRTCNLVTPITISGVSLLEDKTWQSSAASTSSQHTPSLGLPITSPALSTIDIPMSKVDKSLVPASSASHLSFLSSSASLLQSSSSQEGIGVQSLVGLQLQNVTKTALPISTSLPSNLPPLVPEVPQVSVSGMSLQDSSNQLQGQFSGATSCAEAVKSVVQDIFPSINIESSPEVTITSRETITSAVEIPPVSVINTVSATPLENSWSLTCALPAPELKTVGSLARIPSDGNTQTTWTTLQLAGNTIQPLCQTSSSVVPTVVTEPQVCSKDAFSNKLTTACINLSNLVPSEGKLVEQVMVKVSSCQPVPVQSLISQPPSATSILPLNPPVQVIQVAQPIGPALTTAPANQNIILLQPPAPAPCPSVIRAEVPKPTVGQQIVIIQAAPNQNPLPLMPTQPTPSVVVPLNSGNPVVCPTSTAQTAVAPQTFGGKHLVHILPRPTPVSAPASTTSTTQPLPVSTATANQQPPTISLNGQLFALKPVTPSAGASNQTPMQIIQPTTSEDPNTNVALNAFGALANLSQSISQMAGQSCLQFTLNPPPPPPPAALTATNIPVKCVSVAGTNVNPTTTESSSGLNIPSPMTPFSVKPVSGSQSPAKPKKTIKKPSAKKPASAKKEHLSSSKAEKSGSVCEKSSKQPSEREVEGQIEGASELMATASSVQDRSSISDHHSSQEMNNEKVHETRSSAAVDARVEVSMLSESGEQFSADFNASKDPSPSSEICVTQNEQISGCVTSKSFKSSVVSTSSPVPVSNHPISDIPTAGDSTVQTGVNAEGRSEDVLLPEPCVTHVDSSSLMATDLLEVQILSDDPKGNSPCEKVSAKEIDSPGLFCKKIKSKESVPPDQEKSDALTLGATIVPVVQQPSCISEETGASGSCAANRQTDSPMSTSSGSSRNFSVASMLPDSSREDVTSSAPPVPVFSGGTFAEQSDIVAVAARAIFDQESLVKGKTRMQTDITGSASRINVGEMLTGDCRHPYKQQSGKENLAQVPSKPNLIGFNSLDSNPLCSADHLVEKSSCPVGINTTNLSLHISTSQTQSVTSLSINNLIHQGGVSQTISNFGNVSQTSEHVTLNTSGNPAVSSNTYENQNQVSSAISEYSQDQIRSMRTTIMQVTQATESLLKQNDESRKEAHKRSSVLEDRLLSTAKRQKQCQASMRLERMQPPDTLAEQNEVLVSHVPSNSSSANNQAHVDGLSTLFPPNNSFVNPNLRQTDMRCSSQPSISDTQQGQIGGQHLQPLQQQQHAQSQQVSLHHSSNPYLKQQQQQQQANHLREQHHLYQQQQHHVSHAESSLHQQSHNVQQQRLIQQDVQMQKKRSPAQAGQATQMSLQQKPHLSEQNRQKGTQPHTHHQQIQQQIPPHFGSTQADKTCENTAPSRRHHSTHPQGHVNKDLIHQHQQDVGSRPQGPVGSSELLPGHSQAQRLMTSRSLEQQMVSQPSIVSRSTNMTCAPHRQERNRVSSYSAEALIGKSTSNSEQRMAISVQSSRVSEQLEMRKYLDGSRNKGLSVHNMQSRLPIEHSIGSDAQRLSDCQTFKLIGANQQQPGSFDAQTSRSNDGSTVPSMRVMQSQAYRVSQNSSLSMDRQKHLPYQPVQEVPLANTLPVRDNDNSCHQSFMQGLLVPHIGEQVSAGQRLLSGHQRNTPYNSSSGIEYSCPPARDAMHLRRDGDGQNRESCDLGIGQVTSRNNSLNIPFSSTSSSGDIQGRNTSPHVSMQKSNAMRSAESQGAKNHLNIQVSINMHGVVHPAIPPQSISHGNLDQRQSVRQPNPPVTQRSRHPLEEADSKGRQHERNRSANQRHGNMFEPALPHLPLAGPGSMILGRQQPVTDKRTGIVRFMSDSPQVSSDNPAPDQHALTQNFGFPFIPEGTMNPPINANATFIPPVTQTTATRTTALIPVDPQNTLPSFYPPYSPAHPSLPNDITIPYFPNQMFPNPSTEKPNSTGLNNRFGSILSPPRPVGFSQTTFPLLPDMPPMHMANPSHLSNFNLTSLFPEIATAVPADGSAMSPLLPLSHSAASDSSKQSSNRPAHNISHILGHDSSSTV
ncbi:basic helix-loop-helix domain-containing protein USF3 [Rhinophrynus dorsalis]